MRMVAGRAIQATPDVFPVNRQIANGWNPIEGIRKNENQVLGSEDGVRQQTGRTEKTQPPECQWNNHLFALFCGMPLDQNPRKEKAVAHESNQLPQAQGAGEQLIPLRCQIPQPFHWMKFRERHATHQAWDFSRRDGNCHLLSSVLARYMLDGKSD